MPGEQDQPGGRHREHSGDDHAAPLAGGGIVNAPAGAVAIMPAIPPSAVTVPMAPVAQPRLCSNPPQTGRCRPAYRP